MPQAKQSTQTDSKNIIQQFRSPSIFIGLIIILPLVLFYRWIFKGEVLFWGTSMYQFWPWHQLVKTITLSGQWPLWNPLLGNGAPLLANLQTAFFYPLNLLYFLIPVEHGLTLSVILHLILAGILMFVYARAIGLTLFAATVSALTYMFSGYVIGRVQFVTMVNAFAWFPLLLLLAERLATRRRYQNALWLGLVLAIQLLAGHAQLWFYGLWLIGAYVVFRNWQETPGWTGILSSLWQFGLAVGLSVLLTAVQILPTAEFVLQSSRDSGAARYFALTYSFWPWRLVTLLAPDFFGNPAQGNYWGYANYWEDHAYIGILPFLLALIAIWQCRPRLKSHSASDPDSPPLYQRIAPFFIAIIPISLILAMGWNTPVYLWVFELVPGFKFFQAPARLLIWYTLAITILAGIGAQSFNLTSTSVRNWRRLLAASAAITLAGIVGRLALTGKSLTFVNATVTTGILLIASIILLLTYPPKKSTTQRKNLWQTLALFFITADLLWFTYPLMPTLPSTIYTESVPAAEFLSKSSDEGRFMVDDELDYEIKFQKFFRFDTFGPIDLNHWQNFRNTLVTNLGVYTNLSTANNDDPLVVERWQTLINLFETADATQKENLLSMMNVAFYIDEPDRAIWPVIYSNKTMAIQKVPNPLPRTYFVNQFRLVDTDAEVREKLISPQFDPRREVIIMKAGQNLTLQNQTPATIDPAIVTITQESPQQITLAVNAPTAGFVILADTYYPGWQATVDGQPTTIWPANLAFRAVAVEAGAHQIEFTYRPRSFTLGLWISIIALVTVLGISIGTAINQRNGEKD